jgi:hypothetical protein
VSFLLRMWCLCAKKACLASRLLLGHIVAYGGARRSPLRDDVLLSFPALAGEQYVARHLVLAARVVGHLPARDPERRGCIGQAQAVLPAPADEFGRIGSPSARAPSPRADQRPYRDRPARQRYGRPRRQRRAQRQPYRAAGAGPSVETRARADQRSASCRSSEGVGTRRAHLDFLVRERHAPLLRDSNLQDSNFVVPTILSTSEVWLGANGSERPLEYNQLLGWKNRRGRTA